jgi:hypothetical protein
MRESSGADAALARLVRDGLVHRAGDAVKTTRRWQGAMARAALCLVREHETRDDLRIPMAMALLDVYGEVDDDELIAMMEVLLPLEVVTAVAAPAEGTRSP